MTRYLTACIVLLLVGTAHAHPLAPSLLQIEEHEPGKASVLWKRPLLRVPGSALRPVLPSPCQSIGEADVREEGAGLVERWQVDCQGQSFVDQRIEVHGIAESEAGVLLRVVLADGRVLRQFLTADRPSFVVPERQRRFDVGQDYLRLGVGHILTGVDHLLFVCGLVLLVGEGRRRLFWTVTAFTLGHSVTLSLAVLGFAHVPPRPIEALIALSIFAVAVELTRRSDVPRSAMQRRPWVMAFSFGLLHGLGFAGALAEVGLPPGEIPLALFSFNVGIEMGQAAFVIALLALRVVLAPLVARFPVRTDWVPPYVIGSLAAFWFFERAVAAF